MKFLRPLISSATTVMRRRARSAAPSTARQLPVWAHRMARTQGRAAARR